MVIKIPLESSSQGLQDCSDEKGGFTGDVIRNLSPKVGNVGSTLRKCVRPD